MRSRSPGVSVFAFFRTRTVNFTDPTSWFPLRASIVTSFRLMLGRPNFPAMKNGTDAPAVGIGSWRLVKKGPVAFLRNETAPPLAITFAESLILTVGALTPEGFDTRIRQCAGAHVMNR